MIRLLTAVALTLALTIVAHAEPSAEERAVAREHYEKAVNHFNAGRYVPAAEEFLSVYKSIPQPALLYNAAQALRLGNDPTRALEYYRAFAQEAPLAKQHADVERHIKALKNELDAKQTALAPKTTADPAPTINASGTTPLPPAPPAVDKPGSGSDRLQAIAEVIKQNRAGFRACFDPWSKTQPGVNGRVALTFYLDPDGNLDQPNADEKGFSSREVGVCMEALARTLHYPKSPSGKFTRFTYPFDFKAAR